jgi:hypothetical protein
VSHIVKEGVALFGVVAELMAQNPEGARAVAEAPRNFMRRLTLNKKGAKGFVLALERLFRGKEKASLRG